MDTQIYSGELTDEIVVFCNGVTPYSFLIDYEQPRLVSEMAVQN